MKVKREICDLAPLYAWLIYLNKSNYLKDEITSKTLNTNRIHIAHRNDGPELMNEPDHYKGVYIFFNIGTNIDIFFDIGTHC